MTEETLVTIIWAIVFIFAIREVGSYCQMRLLVTGKVFFQRRESEVSKIVGPWRNEAS